MNAVRTAFFLGLLTGLMMLIGGLIGGQGGVMFAFIFAAVMNLGAWWFSDSIALRMAGAREVTREQAPELYNLVESLAKNANLPMPRVYIIQTDVPNAFATGRSPKKAAVAATTGIMRVLSREELAGVMAHELAHVKNRDTLTSSIAATIAGAISMIANWLQWSLFFGGFGGRRDDSGAGNILAILATVILAPIAAAMIQMAISRTREYSADALGAEILGDARPLANALLKIDRYVKGHQPMQINPATSHMYIINPLKGGMSGLFSTHPPTEERVKRLLAIAEKQGHTVMM